MWVRSVFIRPSAPSCCVAGNDQAKWSSILPARSSSRPWSNCFASSSSVYGDHPGLPKTEDTIGRPLSPVSAAGMHRRDRRDDRRDQR